MSSSSSNFNFMFENFTGEGDVSSSMVAILGTLKGVLFPHVEDEFLVKPHSTPIYSKAAVAVLSTGDLINISETNVMSTGGAISQLCDTTHYAYAEFLVYVTLHCMLDMRNMLRAHSILDLQ
uniref:Uncharacterized protein n=1 Tax=Glossina pallidipes TaxID=7398 RepID=A0A1B0AD77_GLOPL